MKVKLLDLLQAADTILINGEPGNWHIDPALDPMLTLRHEDEDVGDFLVDQTTEVNFDPDKGVCTVIAEFEGVYDGLTTPVRLAFFVERRMNEADVTS